MVVGGGEVATRRVAALLGAGASVEVVAPQVSLELEALCDRGTITVARRSFRPSDLDGAWLAFAATDDDEVNRAVVAAAEGRRCFVSCAQPGGLSSASPMAVLRRGALEVAVGTSGRSPALAGWLRRRLESEVGPEFGVLLDLVAEVRDERRAAGQSPDRADWYALFDSGILDRIRAGRVEQAREGLRTCLSSSSG